MEGAKGEAFNLNNSTPAVKHSGGSIMSGGCSAEKETDDVMKKGQTESTDHHKALWTDLKMCLCTKRPTNKQ